MKLVVQRVSEAKVKVEGKVVGEINGGLFVLVGFGREDGQKGVEEMARKIIKMRIMADNEGKMNLPVTEVGGEILVVSQFTLYADTKGGNRPSFIKAAEPDKARDLYRYFIAKLIEAGVMVKTGSFGEYMEIEVELDGPVTIITDN